VEAFNAVVPEGTRPGSRIRVRAPLVEMTKAQIVSLAVELGLPLEMTWSCYSRNDLACGVCDSCALRLRGFEQAGLPDPIRYARTKARIDEVNREKVKRLLVLLRALKEPK
jgi:7-cyano-7-deazaguanine synthase